jgi:hypothetical protein
LEKTKSVDDIERSQVPSSDVAHCHTVKLCIRSLLQVTCFSPATAGSTWYNLIRAVASNRLRTSEAWGHKCFHYACDDGCHDVQNMSRFRLLHSLSHPITILSKEYMHLNSMGHSWIGPPPRAASSTSLNGRVLPNNALNLRTVYTLRSTFQRSTDVVPIRAASNALSRSIPKSRRQATACLSVYRRGAASAVVMGQRCFFS